MGTILFVWLSWGLTLFVCSVARWLSGSGVPRVWPISRCCGVRGPRGGRYGRAVAQGKKITSEPKLAGSVPEPEAGSKAGSAPFQKLEFLVRDWSNFEEFDDPAALRGEMEQYLEECMSSQVTHKELAWVWTVNAVLCTVRSFAP